MNKIILVGLIFLLLNCSIEKQSKEFSMDTIAPEKITIAFYNVENLFDTKDSPFTNDIDFTPKGKKAWNEERYYHKLDNISKVINALNKKDWPVIMGLAEVENADVLEDLIKDNDLIDANYDFVHYESPDERGIDVAMLYRKDFFHVLKKNSINIYNPAFPHSKTRDILYVKGEFYNKEVFHFFVNHWSSRRDGTLETEPKRVFQASILKKHIDIILEKDENAKIIVMGDFNDYPTNKSIRKILKAGITNKDELYNLAYTLHIEDKGTISYKNDWGMFDQFIVTKSIFFKKGLYLKDKKQKILTKDWLIWKSKKPNRTYGESKYYGGFSDHLPTYIELIVE